jgi:hypothetical protein
MQPAASSQAEFMMIQQTLLTHLDGADGKLRAKVRWGMLERT